MDDGFEETAALLESVPGGREVLDRMGGTPNFGDAEVTRLLLDRDGPSILEIETAGPHAGIVTFIFDQWIDVSLLGFSGQNVVGGLKLRRAEARDVAPLEQGVGFVPADIEMVLEPCFGVHGTLGVRIARVEFQPARPSSV